MTFNNVIFEASGAMKGGDRSSTSWRGYHLAISPGAARGLG